MPADPNDLFQQQDDNDLFQQAGINPNASANSPDTSTTSAGQSTDSSNVPQGTLGQAGDIAATAAQQMVPEFPLSKKEIKRLAAAPLQALLNIMAVGGKAHDAYKALGVKPNVLDKLATLGLQYAPFGAGAKLGVEAGAPLVKAAIPDIVKILSPSIVNKGLEKAVSSGALENALGGGTYMAANAPSGQRLEQGGIGTALGAAAPIPGAIANKVLVKPLAGWYAQSAIPGLVKKATDIFGKEPSAEEGANVLQQKYKNAVDENSANWTATKALADHLDNQKGDQAFNAAPYLQHINDFLDKVKNSTPVQQAPYKDAVAFAEQAKDLAPQNFNDVVALRQNLNQHLKDFSTLRGLDQVDANSKNFVKGLKDNLINDTLDANKNLVDPDEFSAFKNTWQDANTSHQNVQNFHKGIGKTGVIKPTQATREAIQRGGPGEAAIIGQYLPKPGQTGIDGFQQLEKVIGGKPQAQQALRSYYLRQVYENGGTSKDVAKLYGNLSKAQRDYVFGTGPGAKNLEAANNALLTLGRQEPRNTLQVIGHHAVTSSIPGAVGYIGAKESGLPWDEALGAGLLSAAAPHAAANIIRRFATPESLSRALQLSEIGRPSSGRFINSLTQTALPALGIGRSQ